MQPQTASTGWHADVKVSGSTLLEGSMSAQLALKELKVQAARSGYLKSIKQHWCEKQKCDRPGVSHWHQVLYLHAFKGQLDRSGKTEIKIETGPQTPLKPRYIQEWTKTTLWRIDVSSLTSLGKKKRKKKKLFQAEWFQSGQCEAGHGSIFRHLPSFFCCCSFPKPWTVCCLVSSLLTGTTCANQQYTWIKW